MIRLLTLIFLIAASWSPFTGAAFAANDFVGKPANTFKAPLLAGGDFDLSPYLGKKAILLDFWSIYCVACVQEMPQLVMLQNKYPEELAIVGVDLDSFGTKRVKKFVKRLRFKIPYPIVVDKRRKVAGIYSVSVLPTTIIIDKNQKIIYYHVGYKPGDEKEIEAKILEAIGSK
jgi:thiol-disulfide isomerase/thioredoxin